MKKLVMTAAVLACTAAIVSAQTVTSANIVGYAKGSVDAGGIDIFTLQFSGSDEGVTLANSFEGLIENESVLYVFNGSTYDVYDYYGPVNGWYKGSTPSDDVVIPKGEAVWLKGGSAAITSMQSGEVPSTNSIAVSCVAGIAFVGNPYPVETELGDLAGTALVSSDTVLYLFNGSTYDVYDYYGPVNGWYKGSTPSDTVKIAVGQGFWLKSTAGGDLDFTRTW